MQKKILIIDDDRTIRRYLSIALSAYGYNIFEAVADQNNISQISSLQPDLILLDIDLPDTNGIEVIKALKEQSNAPIIILSSYDQDRNKVEALDAGADDYIMKPFSIGELMSRIHMTLQYLQPTANIFTFSTGDLQVDLAECSVKVGDQIILLTQIEYKLLCVLINHAGKVITHRRLWQEMQGKNDKPEAHMFRVHMSNLRRKLEVDPTNPQYILTEPGIGYRLQTHLS